MRGLTRTAPQQHAGDTQTFTSTAAITITVRSIMAGPGDVTSEIITSTTTTTTESTTITTIGT